MQEIKKLPMAEGPYIEPDFKTTKEITLDFLKKICKELNQREENRPYKINERIK